ncbi:hypothetical protein LK533_14125 [Sphingomonas sp. PL-96]|uniref:hypothetical protein n=1 Tax=Sphingomonas sp. PL-96 TaxID=2887201 RepID=UPI001E6412E9|nr:hypothetical protein [Sphingomonas sp. PL-96]MCC2977809.1 hypothetical protein [Sphingomonas sp. PL-96]
MPEIVRWLETHESLSGWAQFLGAMLALLLTYFTAFAPMWRRKKQLRMAAARLLSNGFEVVESYHYTSENFLPTSLSLRFAISTMKSVANEIDRFPVYELDDQGPRSLARHLVAVAGTLRGLELYLDALDPGTGDTTISAEDRDAMRTFLAERLALFRDMFSGKELKRPVWPQENN